VPKQTNTQTKHNKLLTKLTIENSATKKSIYEMMNSVVSAAVGNRFNRDGQPETRSSQLELSENEDN